MRAGLLEQLLDDDYFSLPPPKSTGTQYFSAAWLDRLLSGGPQAAPADVQATLLAAEVGQAVHRPGDQQPVVAAGLRGLDHAAGSMF